MRHLKYSNAIRDGFEYLLKNYEDICLMGQGLWSPWYVGSSMTDLEKQFGKDRILDTPVSENGTTGMALGAALTGLKTIVIHPRIDFMILASDQIVNQAAKWQSMLGNNIKIPLTIRGIINRGGEQGAQHSQALHSWYAHIPGLRVVMPATANDARDLLIASALCNDPVIYIDDRWCYDHQEEFIEIEEKKITDFPPQILKQGKDISIVSASYSSLLCLEVCKKLLNENIDAELIDLRVINPIDIEPILKSVKKTKKLIVIDGGWENCGLSGEIIASVSEKIRFNECLPQRITIKNSPAPTSSVLEKEYYPDVDKITEKIKLMLG